MGEGGKSDLIARGTLIGIRLFSVETVGGNGCMWVLWEQRKTSEESSVSCPSPFLDGSDDLQVASSQFNECIV